MSQLSGDQLFLTIKRTASLKDHKVAIYESFDDVLSNWTDTTRASPIFPLNNSAFPETGNDAEWYIFFIGPIDPSEYDLSGLRAFSSYGVYNLLLVGQQEHKADLMGVIETVGETPWEAWHIQGNVILDVAYSHHLTAERSVHPKLLKKPDLPSELRSAAEEYRTLIAVTRTKCARYLPFLTRDFDAFDEQFSDVLSSSEHHFVAKLSWLVNVNAALSRFSSQTFAGTSPLLQTECHFWTHSLLGIGLATQALLNIRRHYDAAMAQSMLPEKLLKLKDVAPINQRKLMALNMRHPDWHIHRLEGIVVDSCPDEDFLKLLVYFSGRDGFRSTNFTLSAPLEVISGCNTLAWTPLTLTHELSHVVASTLISVLLQDVNSPTLKEKFAGYLAPHSEANDPTNAFEQAQEALVHAYYFLERDHMRTSITERITVDVDTVIPLLLRHHGEMFELITHVIDFQYFYQRHVKRYLTSIWASWDVIPNIESRLDDYIIRSLTAVLTYNMLVEDAVERTLDMVESELAGIAEQFTDSIYIHEALRRLRVRRPDFKQRLNNRTHIGKMVMAFLYDPLAAKNISSETPTSGGRYADLRVFEFTEAPISNPLSFLVEYAKDRRPDSRKSLWMLHQLAFADIL